MGCSPLRSNGSREQSCWGGEFVHGCSRRAQGRRSARRRRRAEAGIEGAAGASGWPVCRGRERRTTGLTCGRLWAAAEADGAARAVWWRRVRRSRVVTVLFCGCIDHRRPLDKETGKAMNCHASKQAALIFSLERINLNCVVHPNRQH